MEWVKRLHGQTVAIATAPLIYYIEQDPANDRDFPRMLGIEILRLRDLSA